MSFVSCKAKQRKPKNQIELVPELYNSTEEDTLCLQEINRQSVQNIRFDRDVGTITLVGGVILKKKVFLDILS